MPVIDASIVIAALSPDEDLADARTVLNAALRAGAAAPALLVYELANALHVKTKRTVFDAATRDRLLASVGTLPIAYDAPDPDRTARSIVPLAARLDLSVYDASYLELTMRIGEALATRDAGLRKAADREGVRLL